MVKLITVHGTFAGDEADEGDKWWQRGSPFLKELQEYFDEPLEIEPFHWSGNNSDRDRFRAGRNLAAKLREESSNGRSVHLLAHSHGGNVSRIALAQLNKHELPSSVISLGTPFLKHRKDLLPQIVDWSLYLTAALSIAWTALFILSNFLLYRNYTPSVFTASETDFEQYFFNQTLYSIGLFILAVTVSALVIWYIRKRRWTKITLSRDKAEPWCSIYSTYDEAIAALRFAKANRIKYSSQRATQNSLQSGFNALLILGLIVGAMSFSARQIADEFSYEFDRLEGMAYEIESIAVFLYNAWQPFGAILIAYPVFTIGFYLINKLVLSHLSSTFSNTLIGGAIKSSALGVDFMYTVKSVEKIPEKNFGCEVELNDRSLGRIDQNAIVSAYDEIYEGVIKEIDRSKVESNAHALWDRLNSALYHNAYFEDEETIEYIAQFIITGRVH